MSKISLAPNAAGTAIFTIESPGTSTNRTLTLPDDTGTIVTNSGNQAGSFTTLNTSGAVVFNDAGADVDFRVEGDTDANLLFVDASADAVGIGTSSPLRRLHVAVAGDAGFMLQTTAANADSQIWEIQAAGNASNNADFIIRQRLDNGTGGSERMRIDSSGDILAATGGGWTGTVAQSSSSTVFQTGSNANGTYIRYADGTQICFTPYSLDFTLPDLNGLNTYDNWTFPAAFLDENYVAYGSADGATGNILVAWGGSFSSTTAIRFRTNQDISTEILMLLAVGRWY